MTLDQLRILAATFIRDKAPEVNMVPEQWAALLRIASLKHFKRKIGLPEEYAPGRPLPAQIPEISQRITDDLLPFKVHMGRNGYPKLAISANGEAVIPTDFFYPLSLMYPVIDSGQLVYNNVEVLTDSEWVDYLSSKIITPNKKYPIANFQKSYIRFAPINLQSVEFTYLKKPVDPVYAYTIANDFIEYDPVHSVELEWDELNKIDILYILLSDIGVVVTRGDIVQLSEKVKQQGI
jgi:hypothetical protein